MRPQVGMAVAGMYRRSSPNTARSWPPISSTAPRAVAMSVYVIRAFVKMREEVAAIAAILRRLAEIDKTLLVHDVTLREILQKLRPLLEPPPQPIKPEIGFHVKEDAVRYRVRKKN